MYNWMKGLKGQCQNIMSHVHKWQLMPNLSKNCATNIWKIGYQINERNKIYYNLSTGCSTKCLLAEKFGREGEKMRKSGLFCC